MAGPPANTSWMRYGGAPERFVAFAVDGVLLAAIYLLVDTAVALVMLGSTPWTAPWSDPVARLGPGLAERYLPYLVLSRVLSTAAEIGYFVLGWTSRWQATPGMRLLRLRIGREVDGGRLARVPALRRWVTMGSWIGLAGLLPLVDQLAGYAILAWSVVLLVTVLRSGTRQGFHDRVGRSVVLEPSTRTGHPLAVGCLTLVGILFALAVALGLAGFWNAMDAAGLAP